MRSIASRIIVKLETATPMASQVVGIDHFAKGIIKKPLTTFGNVKADVLALKDMHFVRQDFCSTIFGSAWPN